MPMTLQEYDERIGRHLSAIRYYTGRVEQHVREMNRKANFETIAEEELLICEGTVADTLQRIRNAIKAMREKPPDA